MADDLVAPRWPHLTSGEVHDVLAHYLENDTTNPPRVTWRSPRPMSAAALVSVGDSSVFVKRHHVRVRTPERLRIEHDFVHHLRERGCSLPDVLRTLDGDSVVALGEFVYEVHER